MRLFSSSVFSFPEVWWLFIMLMCGCTGAQHQAPSESGPVESLVNGAQLPTEFEVSRERPGRISSTTGTEPSIGRASLDQNCDLGQLVGVYHHEHTVVDVDETSAQERAVHDCLFLVCRNGVTVGQISVSGANVSGCDTVPAEVVLVGRNQVEFLWDLRGLECRLRAHVSEGEVVIARGFGANDERCTLELCSSTTPGLGPTTFGRVERQEWVETASQCGERMAEFQGP